MTPEDRRVSVLSPEPGPRSDRRSAQCLGDFRDAGAYVLLGDPGMGKTTAFRRESRRTADSRFLTVRDFLAQPPGRGAPPAPTLFLDGLDEVRPAGPDPRRPFDRLRERLADLGRPRFRISCCTPEWPGGDDRDLLSTLSPDGEVAVLRLEPLGDGEIAAFLRDRPDLAEIGDPARFVETAKARGIGALLENPLTLALLATAVAAGDGWPVSRRDLFERAALRLARETIRARPPPRGPAPTSSEVATERAVERFLESAGALPAVRLLSGSDPHSPGAAPAPPAFRPDETPPTRRRDTTGFAADPLADRRTAAEAGRPTVPATGLPADYLAARYLARLAAAGRPPGRLLALLAGDAIPPTPLRPLVGWLAVLSPPLRRRLFALDPEAVAAYGDPAEFAPEEQRALLDALARRSRSLGSVPPPDASRRFPPWSGLAETVTALLRADLGAPSAEAAVQFAVSVLPPERSSRALLRESFRLSRDRSVSGARRSLAARAFVAAAGPGESEQLLTLLDEARRHEFHGPDDRLADRLLSRLYPDCLPPSKVWDYFPHSLPTAPGLDPRRADRHSFWREGLERASSDLQVAELLDDLSPHLPALEPDLDRAGLSALPLRLLARGLRAFGDELSPARLYDWLRVGAVGNTVRGSAGLPPEAEVRGWLADRPRLVRRVLDDALRRFAAEPSFASRFYDLRRLFYDALPPDFGRYCLDRALTCADTAPEAAGVLLAEAVETLCRGIGAERLSVDLLFRETARHPHLAEALGALLRFDLPEPYYRTNLHGGGDTLDFDGPLHRWNAEARSELARLGAIRSLPLVRAAAAAGFGRFPGVTGARPGDRLRRLCGHDPSLLRAVRRALSEASDRAEDLSVADLLARGERTEKPEPAPADLLALPCLAAAEEAATASPTGIPRWSDDRLRRAIAFHLVESRTRRTEPTWFAHLVSERPALVAEVLTAHGRVELAAGGAVEALSVLDRRKASAGLAERVTLPLLRSFPTRAGTQQLPALDSLLRAALRHADRPRLAAVIARKARSRTLTAAARARWLAAGFAVSPGRYRRALDEFLAAEPERAPIVATLWWPGGADFGNGPLADADAGTLAFAIRTLGAAVEPEAWPRTRIVSVASHEWAERAVSGLVRCLAAHPDRGAAEELEALTAVPALLGWRDELRAASRRRALVFRDLGFRFPTPEAVRAALADGAPANAADLRELVAARLRDLGNDLRRESEGPWRLFWNDRYALRPTEPRPAEGCRDAVLQRLGDRLPEGVSARPVPEGAGFVVVCGDRAVPVEVRRNDDPRLWHPLCHGSTEPPAPARPEVVAVLWLRPDRTPVPPEGRPPAGAAEAEERLRAALSSSESAPRTSICVLDARPTEITQAQQVAEPDASWARQWPGSSLPPSRW